jgi:hypothetical protein
MMESAERVDTQRRGLILINTGDGKGKTCAFSKLNPDDFVGDLEASAIACVHGEAIE